MKTLMCLFLTSLVLVLNTGCASMVRNIYDKDTGKLEETQTFSGDLSCWVVKDLSDKIVFDFTNAFIGRLEVQPPDKENPTGTVKIEVINGEVAHLTIPKDTGMSMDQLSCFVKLISASAGKDISMTDDGVNTKTVTAPASTGPVKQ